MANQPSKTQAFEVQSLLGYGHVKYGVVDPRIPPSDDDDGGDSGIGELSMENGVLAHPLLDGPQFNSDFDMEAVVPDKNASKETQEKVLQNRKQHEKQLEQQHVSRPKSAPTPKPF